MATNVPHSPALASDHNDGTYAGRTMPKSPAFNEADVSDKAKIWQEYPRLENVTCPPQYRKDFVFQCLAEVDEVWQNRMESLQDVDDMVGRLIGTLRERGTLENTYVVFSSDNGYAMYDNRIYSKGAPYENSHKVPLIVRGPGVSAGRTDDRLVANVDLAPTFAKWANARTPPFVDGRSLVPILSDPGVPWRTKLLFEQRLGDIAYDAVRTSSDEVFIDYPRTNESVVLRLEEGLSPARWPGREAPDEAEVPAPSSERLRRRRMPQGGQWPVTAGVLSAAIRGGASGPASRTPFLVGRRKCPTRDHCPCRKREAHRRLQGR